MPKIPETSSEIHNYLKIFVDINQSYEWFYHTIYGDVPPPCFACRRRLNLIQRSNTTPCFRCSSCQKQYSFFYNTQFMASKLPLNKILLALLLIWLNVSQFQISLLSNISRHTIGYFQSISRVVLMEKLQIETIKLGGPGKHVQIDEAIVRKRKYHRGRQKKQIWIFGMVEEEADGFTKLLLTTVPDRSMWTLIPLICRHCLPGSTIVSDEWAAYRSLDVMAEFQHITVNHSKEFKNTETGACTNKIEGVWSHIRRYFPVTGVREKFIEDYLASFIVRHQAGFTFEQFVQGVTMYKNEDLEEKNKIEIKQEAELTLSPEEQILYRELHYTGHTEDPFTMTATGGQGEAVHATEQGIADSGEDVPVLGATYSDSETSDDPYGAGTGESASEYEDS